MRQLFATLALAGALCAASPAIAIEVSCETVREYRAEIEGMSKERRAFWTQKLKITRKQRRQAMACLKGRD